jgi:tetratricopeptide (TPR) repeat protein
MEKFTQGKDADALNQKINFPLKNENETAAPGGSRPKKDVRVFGTIEEAFNAFDNLDEHDGRMEFVLRRPEPAAEAVELPPISHIEAATDLPPIPPEAEFQDYLLRNALLLIDAGEFRLARNVLGDILRRNNNNVEAVRWIGWCFKQEGDLANALKCYEQLVELRVTDQDLFELGEIHYTLGNNREALAAWLDALGQCEEQSPRLFDLHKNLGNVYTRLGDFDGAEENYNKALVIRPNSDVLQVNLGSLNFQKQFYRISLEHFKKAVELNPFSDRGWCGVALVAREMKDAEWARASILKSLDINPYNLTSLQVLVNWAQQDLTFDDAVERTQKYVDENQDDAEMIYALAGLHFQKGDLNSAEIELVRLEALDPERADIAELRHLIEIKRAETQG